jgi:diadenylate cyclase
MNAFDAYLRRVSLTTWDVVDILIVAVVLYEFMKLIRGTRAVQMAVGSATIALVFFASRWAPLQTVNWLIRNMFAYVVFAAIVIFQSDIRRALAHFGRAPFFRYFSRVDDVSETLEEMTVAASMLADKRTGAIIVLERAIGLRNYSESGIPLEAIVTHDVLVSIFQIASPLHDGAVIIQENRIAAAACFLPLTVNPQLSRELGTRHRAAIGVTEETDAIAVVVSEETGKISLAIDGQIERGLATEQLRARLRALMSDRRRRARARARPRDVARM